MTDMTEIRKYPLQNKGTRPLKDESPLNPDSPHYSATAEGTERAGRG